jgi:hypothetical protein
MVLLQHETTVDDEMKYIFYVEAGGEEQHPGYIDV